MLESCQTAVRLNSPYFFHPRSSLNLEDVLYGLLSRLAGLIQYLKRSGFYWGVFCLLFLLSV